MLVSALLLSTMTLSDIAPGCEHRYELQPGTNEERSECRFEFNGVIVDQDGEAVPGVRIQTDVSQYGSRLLLVPRGLTMTSLPHDRETETTDAQGRFRFRSKGHEFQIKLEKNGYEFTPLPTFLLGRQSTRNPAAQPKTARHEVFWQDFPNRGPAQPAQVSRDEPFVIRAWKKGEPAYLLESGYDDERFYLQPDATYTLDLLRIGDARLRAGNESGDLRLSLHGESIQPDARRPEFTQIQWLVKLEALGGGLIETQDPFLYLAPASGYQTSIDLRLREEGHFGHSGLHKFYFRSRNGAVYGRLELGIDGTVDNPQRVVLRLRHAANPQGERNLLGGLTERPTRFSGRLVDQAGAPVTDHPIAAVIGPRQDERITMIKTDGEGRFEYQGGISVLGLEVQRRRGFAFPQVAPFHARPCSDLDEPALSSPERRAFWQWIPLTLNAPQIRVARPANKWHADPCRLLWNSAAEPYVIDAWRFGPPADLKPIKARVEFATDDESHVVDLLPTPGNGDLRLTLSARPPDSDGTIHWTLRVEAPGGGLLPAAGPYSYEAPAAGYVARDQLTSGNGWALRTYFARLRGGAAYAVFNVAGFMSDKRFAGVDVSGWVNTSGERNLANAERIEQAAKPGPNDYR